ncbi:synapsin-3-like, partial [Alosa sapidissima]|uniref:synapsin-3-like n=1 Tax=Alosa sapidissima TaxID=34773 RepID=UPI001C08E76D
CFLARPSKKSERKRNGFNIRVFLVLNVGGSTIPQASISQYQQPSSGTSATAFTRDPSRGLSTQPAGPTAHRHTGQGHQQQQQQHPEAQPAKPVPPRRRNSKTQSQSRPQEQLPAQAAEKGQDQGRRQQQQQVQLKRQEQVQSGAGGQLQCRPQDQLPPRAQDQLPGVPQSGSPPQAQSQSPTQSLSPPELLDEAKAQPDASQEQQATQGKAQGHPQLNKSQSLSNAFGLGDKSFFRMASEDVAKAESIRNLRKSFVSLFSD